MTKVSGFLIERFGARNALEKKNNEKKKKKTSKKTLSFPAAFFFVEAEIKETFEK